MTKEACDLLCISMMLWHTHSMALWAVPRNASACAVRTAVSSDLNRRQGAVRERSALTQAAMREKQRSGERTSRTRRDSAVRSTTLLVVRGATEEDLLRRTTPRPEPSGPRLRHIRASALSSVAGLSAAFGDGAVTYACSPLASTTSTWPSVRRVGLGSGGAALTPRAPVGICGMRATSISRTCLRAPPALRSLDTRR